MVGIAKDKGFRGVFRAGTTTRRKRAVVDGIDIFPVATLSALVNHLRGEVPLAAHHEDEADSGDEERNSSNRTLPTSRGRSMPSGLWRLQRQEATIS